MSQSGPTLVILAAGMGSRYGGLKQIDPVGPHGEIVIDYSIRDAIAAGFSRAVFVIRRELEADFQSMIDRHVGNHIPCELVCQELTDLPTNEQVPATRDKPWGTAHAIYAARHAVRQPFGVINADDFYGAHSFQLLADLLKNPEPDTYALIAFTLHNTLSDHGTVSRGICHVQNGLLHDVVERTAIEKTPEGARFVEDGHVHTLNGAELVSMNMWGFTPSYFDHLDAGFRRFLAAHRNDEKAEFQIPTITDKLIRSGLAKVKVASSRESWLGVTYPEDKVIVQRGIKQLVDEGVYPAPLWPGQAASV